MNKSRTTNDSESNMQVLTDCLDEVMSSSAWTEKRREYRHEIAAAKSSHEHNSAEKSLSELDKLQKDLDLQYRNVCSLDLTCPQDVDRRIRFLLGKYHNDVMYDAVEMDGISQGVNVLNVMDDAMIELPSISPHIRWMIDRDIPEVFAIQNNALEFPWSYNDFIKQWRQRNCIGMVSEWDERVIGYMLYELHKDHMHLVNLTVDPNLHRKGVGLSMIDKVKSKMSKDRRNHITVDVRETDLPAQQFLRSMRFRAASVLRNFFDDTNEDAYLMKHKFQDDSVEELLTNRISKFLEE